MKPPDLGALLCCPACRAPLLAANGGWTCGGCAARFETENGIPNFWPPAERERIRAALDAHAAPRAGLRRNALLRALIPPSAVFSPRLNAARRRARELLATGAVANLGAKSDAWGGHVLTVDLVAPERGGVDVLADLHALPFRAGALDGAVCTYVLEHVADAPRCCAELARVVKPGGHVFVTVPFLFPEHPDPLDHARWTQAGLEHALRDFEPLDCGPDGGPFSVFVALAPGAVGSLLPGFVLNNAARFALGWLLWPLKFLDLYAARTARARSVASGFFFLGRRR